MVLRKCHFAIVAFSMCLLSCKADDPRLVISDTQHSTLSSITNSKLNASAVIGGATSPTTPSVSASPDSTPSSVTPSLLLTTLAAVKDNTPIVPVPSTVSPDPDNPPTKSTDKPITQPTTTPTDKPITQPTTTSTDKPTEKPTIKPSPVPTSTTVKPTITTPKDNVTTVSPVTTEVPEHHHNRQFDGPSFIGGIVLASGLMAIGFVAFKFYKARTERNYHTL